MASNVEVIEVIVNAWIDGPSEVSLSDSRATLILALVGEFNRLESVTRAQVAEEIAAAIEAEDKGKTICACGHGTALHPSGGCIHGMTWTKPATCPCRSYEPQPVPTEIPIDRAARIAREHGKES